MVGTEGDDSKLVKESDLTGYLHNELIEITNTENLSDSSTKNSELAKSDYQLYKALNLLKGMTLLQPLKNG